jgi:hypothetical protein
MPVLIEGVCVLLKKGAIHQRYQGGYGQFIFDLVDQSKLWSSNELLSIRFDDHAAARKYLAFVAAKGLKVIQINEEDPHNTDALLVDQIFGPSFKVYWLNFLRVKPSDDERKVPRSKKNPNKDFELLVLVATDDEMEAIDEVRRQCWKKDEITFPKDWEFTQSQTMDLDFMRMSENRSYLDH